MTTIRRRNPARGLARFYRTALQWALALTGTNAPGQPTDLIREWGRIGSPGTVRTDPHDSEGDAQAARDRIVKSKRRRGYQ